MNPTKILNIDIVKIKYLPVNKSYMISLVLFFNFLLNMINANAASPLIKPWQTSPNIIANVKLKWNK